MYLAKAGTTIEEIKARGDWASKTVYSYLKTPLQTRILNDLRVATSLAAAGDGEMGRRSGWSVSQSSWQIWC